MSKLTSGQRKACAVRRTAQLDKDIAIALDQLFINRVPVHKSKIRMDQAKHNAQEVRKCANRSAVMLIEQKVKHHKMRSFTFGLSSI